MCCKCLKRKITVFNFRYQFIESARDDIDLFIGIMTKQKLKQLLHDGDIEERESDRFFEAVRAFYETAYNYCQR